MQATDSGTDEDKAIRVNRLSSGCVVAVGQGNPVRYLP